MDSDTNLKKKSETKSNSPVISRKKTAATTIYEKTETVGYSSLNVMGNLKVVSIMNILQDVASEHASQLGVSGLELAEEGLGWVVHRYRIHILAHPEWQEKIQTRTWRFPVKNIYELRQLDLFGKNMQPLVTARTAWVMVRRNSRKPVRLSRFMKDDLLLEYQKKVKDFTTPKPLSLGTPFTLPFKIRMQDIDLNGHVNNAVYVGWAVETAPGDFLENHRPAQIDVCFKKESFYGDGIISRTIFQNRGTLETFTTIFLEETEEELACLNILWKPLTRKRQ